MTTKCILIAVFWFQCSNTEDEVDAARCATAIKILDILRTTDDVGESYGLGGSRVEIESKTRDRIIALGLDAIPSLILIMETKDLSFDTFARCYSACNDIFRKGGDMRGIPFSGSARTKEKANGVKLLAPGGQMDGAQFRNFVLEKIKDRYKEIKK
jgi:hypothetical protein